MKINPFYFYKMIGKVVLSILGYKIEPSFSKAFKKQHIAIFPHTSYMESFIFCMALLATNNHMNISFCVAKEYMDYPILGNCLYYFGGFPTSKGMGITKSTIDFLLSNPTKSFAISPEGKLKAGEWNTGFFYIAKSTKIPIIIAGVDFNSHIIKCKLDKEIIIDSNDNFESRIEEIKSLFANSGIVPRFPNQSNPQIITNGKVNPSYLPLNRKILFSVILITFGIKIFL